MATKSGLARRLAFMIMRGIVHTYKRLLLGIVVADFLLTFIVPSGIARVVIMSAVATGLVDAFGVGRGSRIGKGLFILLVYTATIFDKMIIAGAASITARGLIERVGGVHVLWSQWFLAYLPCDILTIFIAWRLVLWMYPPEKEALPGGAAFLHEEVRRRDPESARMEVDCPFRSRTGPVDDRLHPPHFVADDRTRRRARHADSAGRVLDLEDVKKVSLLPVFFWRPRLAWPSPRTT